MKKQSQQVQVLLAFLLVLFLIFIGIYPDFLAYAVRGPALATVAAMFAALGAKAASDYLRSRSILLKTREDEAQKRRENIANDFENLEVGDLKHQLEEIKGLISKIGENELQAISEQLRTSLLSGAAEELIAELKRKIAVDDNSRRLRLSVSSTFGSSQERLSNEVEMLRARANTNLIIGCFIALFGAAILGGTLFLSDSRPATLSDLALHMTPKLSVVILIELFAYFFLTMYRTNLSEIRYYQNELTNIEMRKVGTLLAVFSGSAESVLKELSSTERNGIMKNDQTTQELEKLKIERVSMKNTIDTLTSFFKGKH